ncbi:MAG: TIGR03618 family F420-dependent PPOX class oxidoreductase [Solirubrobacteraceae bacterium]
MTDLNNADVQKLLTDPNSAVISTHNPNGTILSTVVWIELGDGFVAVNSAVGRKWPTNLQRDPRTSIVVMDGANGFYFVSIRGEAEGSLEDADDQIDRLAKKYIGQDKYPWRQPDEQRIKFTIKPDAVRLVKQ